VSESALQRSDGRRGSIPRPLAAALGIALLLAAGRAPARGAPLGPAAGPGPRVTNVWVEVPLSQVLRDVSMESGIGIAMDPSVADQLVSLQVEEAPLEEVLRRLTVAQGLTARRLADDFYLVGSGRPDSPSFGHLADFERMELKYITGKHLHSSLPRTLQSYVAIGERPTEVLAAAPADKLERIREAVRLLDVPRRQIVLEALVVELSRDAGRKLGVDWEWSGRDTALSLTEMTDQFTGVFRHTSIDERQFRTLLLTLRTLVRDGDATIRSRPRVATLNGEKATIEVQLEEYFNIVTDINGTFLRTELQMVKSGVVLEMTPQIGEGEDITVKVATEVGDVTTRRNTLGEDNGSTDTLPVIRRRRADTRVRVQAGDAIVIGGLIESTERNEEKRVPVLGSVPLLGALFRSTTSSTVQKEVMIFITPRLMEPGEAPLSERHEMINAEEELQGLRR
jgi:type II secretory pathway component GspD/PulD (secretin)